MRHLLHGRAEESAAAREAMAADLKAFGFSAEAIQRALEAPSNEPERPFEVEDRGILDALRLFAALTTQWRWVAGHGFALRVGLDLTAAPIAARALGLRLKGRLFDDLLTCEGEALAHYASRSHG